MSHLTDAQIETIIDDVREHSGDYVGGVEALAALYRGERDRLVEPPERIAYSDGSGLYVHEIGREAGLWRLTYFGELPSAEPTELHVYAMRRATPAETAGLRWADWSLAPALAWCPDTSAGDALALLHGVAYVLTRVNGASE